MIGFRQKKNSAISGVILQNGTVLLSPSGLSSPLRDFTSVFGMGTGVTPSLWAPMNLSYLVEKDDIDDHDWTVLIWAISNVRIFINAH